MDPRFSEIFIVTYGRTGSTLLQALLDTAPGVDIEGENYGFLYFLYSARRALRSARAHVAEAGADRVGHPFYGAARRYRLDSEKEILDLAGRFLRHGNPDSVVCGFKDVRYDVPDLEDYLDFLAAAAARPFFLFLTRNHDDVLSSGDWRKADAAEARSRLRAMEQAFAGFAKRHADRTASLDYLHVAAAGPELRAVFERLGLAFDEAAVAATLAREHSYNAKSALLFHGSRLQIAPRHLLDAHLHYYRFDVPSFAKAGTVAVGGILLPRDGKEIAGLSCAAPGGLPVGGKIGLPSPGVAKRYPALPAAGRARFAIEFPSAAGVQTIRATVAGETLELAQFHPAPDGRQFNLHPLVAQTGEVAL